MNRFDCRLSGSARSKSRSTIVSLFVLMLVGISVPARAEIRSYDGTGNNILNTAWGSAESQLLRLSNPAYADGILTPSGNDRPNARTISNLVVAQSGSAPNGQEFSDWVFQWGQFIDHDLDLTELANPAEPFNISVPPGDPVFFGDMPFSRSRFDPATSTSAAVPRQQINSITSYIDASMVYGSNVSRAIALRSMTGGHLLMSEGDMMPFNTIGLDNGTGGAADPTQFFVGGDVRANEQVGLTAVHTLFVREHNRLADVISAANPGWNDEQVYQAARRFVGAEIQNITYTEFLPAILGKHAPGINSVYDPATDSSVAVEFSTAFFRVGHTMLSPQLLRIDNEGNEAPGGPIPLRSAFFLPHNLANSSELEYILKGLASQLQQEVDVHVVDDVRNFLFGEPIPGTGFDLAALNIQRGRDHGMADYNSLRVAYGLPPINAFADITSDPTVQAALEQAYGDIHVIDPWVGALAEDHLAGSALGPLMTVALVDQFTRSRDGDRFWFTNDPTLSPADIEQIQNTRLSDIIRWNSNITNLQDNVFLVPEPEFVGLAVASLLYGFLIGGFGKRVDYRFG